jgi:hypothetical protein
MSSWAREGAGGKYGVGTMTVSSPAGQDGIFISYRTGGGSFAADRLHGRLAHHFSRQVFYAPGGIRLAQNFADMISDALRSCKVLLALIGDRWLTATDRDGRRRLDKSQDHMWMEIEAARGPWGSRLCRDAILRAAHWPHT